MTDVDGLSLLCKKITQKVMDKVAEDISGMIVGARLFAECRLHDASGAACTGFQAYIEVDRGTASDALKLLMGRAAELLLHIDKFMHSLESLRGYIADGSSADIEAYLENVRTRRVAMNTIVSKAAQ